MQGLKSQSAYKYALGRRLNFEDMLTTGNMDENTEILNQWNAHIRGLEKKFDVDFSVPMEQIHIMRKNVAEKLQQLTSIMMDRRTTWYTIRDMLEEFRPKKLIYNPKVYDMDFQDEIVSLCNELEIKLKKEKSWTPKQIPLEVEKRDIGHCMQTFND